MIPDGEYSLSVISFFIIYSLGLTIIGGGFWAVVIILIRRKRRKK